MRLQSRCWSELRSSDGLTGARGSASRWLIHMVVSRMLSLVPCWLLAGRLNSSPYGLLCKVAWVSLWLKELVVQERARRSPQCLLQYSLKSRASSFPTVYSWEANPLGIGFHILHGVDLSGGEILDEGQRGWGRLWEAHKLGEFINVF